MFTGSLVALATPMHANGKIDESAMASFVDWQIAQGTQGLVPVGTTGESPTLSYDEHRRVVEITIEAASGRVPVIAGAGSNCTAEAIELAQHAKDAGADAVLVVTPYYNKPTQEGLFLHFTAIADAVDIPLIDLQHPAPLRGRHERRDHGAAGPAPEHRRREGCDGQPGPSAAPRRRPAVRMRSCSCPARTTPRSLSWRPAGRAASASRPTSHPRLCSEMHAAWAGWAGGGGDGDPAPAGAAARRDVRREPARAR